MKAIIVEDEQLAAARLADMIRTCDPSMEIEAFLESVEESVEWFRQHPSPDLVFLDIHLEDGLSFAIFEQVQIDVPVIFTTAYDEYALKAFRLNSIDYLLKPISREDLERALVKFWDRNKPAVQLADVNKLYRLLLNRNQHFRERFSVVVGQKIRTIGVPDIAYFFSTSGITFVVMKSRNQYSVDQSLDQLTRELDPGRFFRVNRQYLVQLQAISNIHVFPKGRLKIELNPPSDNDGIFVSMDKVVEFKKWLDGKHV